MSSEAPIEPPASTESANPSRPEEGPLVIGPTNTRTYCRRGRLRRFFSRRSLLWPFLLCVAAAVYQAWPILQSGVVKHFEIVTLIALIVEAKRAILEGQIPIRELAFQHGGPRYPLFQFYCNFPLTLEGLISLIPGADAYLALKAVIFTSLATGGFFACLCARRLTRHVSASLWAGPIFLLAPYLFTDFTARAAIAELLGLCLLPVAMYVTMRCFATSGRRYVLLTAVVWTALSMTHSITYLYGALFVGLFILLRLRPRRRELRRIGRLVAAGMLHVLLVLWYIVPPLYIAGDLNVSSGFTSPWVYAYLISLTEMVLPFLFTATGSTTARLGLQIGWPVLAAIAAAAVLLPVSLFRPLRARGPMRLLLLLTAGAAFMAWSPVDFWKDLPKTLWYVQFPYRLLGFVAFFGALLASCVLAACFPRRVPVSFGILLALFVAQAAGTYLDVLETVPAASILSVKKPQIIGSGKSDYLPATMAASLSGWPIPQMNLAAPEFGICDNATVTPPGGAYVPVPLGATGLKIEGQVAPGPAKHFFAKLDDSRVEKDLPPGHFTEELQVSRPGAKFSVVELSSGENRFDPAITFKSIQWQGLSAPAEPFVSAEDLHKSIRYGKATKATFTLDQASFVELPVFYYPRVLRVTDNDKPIAYGNLGRYLVMRLPAGHHLIKIQFVGIVWANVASLIGLTILLLSTLWPLWGRRLRAKRSGSLTST